MRTEQVAPVLVLGLGNPLLRDDGVGLELLQALRERLSGDAELEFVDGGTLGTALLGQLAGRRVLLILDAVSGVAEPGGVTLLRDPLQHGSARGFGAHGANASGLLASAELLGDLPRQAAVVGVCPLELTTGIGLSEPVQRALPEALEMAERVLAELRAKAETEPLPREGATPFTS